MSSWLTVLLEPAKAVLSQIGQFFASLLLVIIILIIGWVISKIIKAIVVKVLSTLRLDDLSSRIKLDDVLSKGGIKYSLSEMIGVICYWLALLVTIMVAINAVGLTIAADLLNKVVLYIPNIIAAIFILVLGMFAAALLKNMVQATANNIGLSQGKLLSKIVEIAVVVFAVLISLEQLNIGANTIQLAISIVLGALGLAFAIAVGLGCRDIAEKAISEFIDGLKKK